MFADTLTFGPWHALLVGVAIVGEVLSVVFVYRVLVRGGSTASTLLWMLLILATPWLGLLLYYLLPRRLQLRRLRRMQDRGARLREVRPGREQSDDRGHGDPDRHRETREHGLEALLQRHGSLSCGNQVAWLPAGEPFFAAAEAAVAKATQHVHCVVYILRPDATGLRFLEVLTTAARRGVQVRLCYDSFGSFGLKSSHLQPLRAAGGRAEAFLPLLWRRRPFTVNLRNHRKLLLVDGQVAFVGGRNIADEYRHDRIGKVRRWHDAMLEVRGPACDALQDVFVQDWCTATDEVLADTFRPQPSASGSCRVGIVSSGPDQDASVLWFAVVQAIAEARERVQLSSPYLVLPPTLRFALQLAAARGIEVHVYTNGPAAEAAFLYHAQRHHYRQLLDAGVNVHETVEHYNHAKVLVVDQRHVFVGSANMDLRSAHLNFEIAAVAFDAPQLAEEVCATLAERREGYRTITAERLPTNPLVRALDGLCGLFSPLL